tara:strand:+ start:6395 stop:7378 length:984 start_codon:yes stop_codon:yes gene_type:complete
MKRLEKIIIKTLSTKKIGMGHLSGMLFINKELKKNYNVLFIINDDKAGINLLNQNKVSFKVDKNFKMNCEILDQKSDLIIYDYPMNKLKITKKIKCKTIFYSNSKYKILSNANIVIASHNAQSKIKYPNNFYTSFDYKLFEYERYEYKFSSNINLCMVCLGGTDKKRFTKKVLEVLEETDLKINFLVFLRSEYIHPKELDFYNKINKENIKIIYDLNSVAPYVKKIDFAIVSAGNILLQICKANIPNISLPQSNNEFEGAKVLESLKCTFLGLENNKSFSKEYFKNLILNKALKLQNRKTQSQALKEKFSKEFLGNHISLIENLANS